jgi:hypothetical protein
MEIWSILQPFGIFYGHWICFVDLWYVVPKQNLANLSLSCPPPIDGSEFMEIDGEEVPFVSTFLLFIISRGADGPPGTDSMNPIFGRNLQEKKLS